MNKTRGPAPQPTALREMRGNPGKKALNDREPVVGPGSVDPPDWLTGHALELWNDLAPKFLAMGCLGDVDRAALAGACKWWGVYRDAMTALEDGCVQHMKIGITIRPEFNVADRAWNQCMTMLQKFGMTPGERARLRVSKEKPKSKWAGLIAS